MKAQSVNQLGLILMMSLTIILVLAGASTSRAQSTTTRSASAAKATPAPAQTNTPTKRPPIKTPTVAGPSISSPGGTFGLDDFLSQVAGGNPAYRAAQEGYEGAKRRNAEKNVIFMPNLEAMYQEGRSEAPTYTPNINGDRTDASEYNIGISKNFSFGTTAKLSYGRTFRDTMGDTLNTTMVPVPRYYTAAPVIELNQPLWRNGFGSEFRAQSAAVGAAQKLALYEQRSRLDGVRIEAENTYNSLYFAREILRARRESLDVNTKLFSWMRGRAANELAESSDLVQARAAKELSELEVLKAEEDEKTASRAFNNMRGVSADEVKEVLVNPIVRMPEKVVYDAGLEVDALRIAEQSLVATRSQSQLSLETYKPSLDLYGSYSHNGLAQTESSALHNSWKDDHPIYSVGIKFKAPLFFWDTHDIRRGYRQEVDSKDLLLQKQKQDSERNQRTLVSNLQSLKRRYELSQSLLTTQRQKWDLERRRHQRGRTTLFQVLQYEQDYLLATLNLIQYQSELIQQINQYSLYRKD